MYHLIASIVLMTSMVVVNAPHTETMSVKAYVVNQSETRRVYQYTSRVSETDGSPCISANGWNICKFHDSGINICAANFVPIGTYLYVDGLGSCVVADRMNKRYKSAVDWYAGYGSSALYNALQWGIRPKQVDVIIK